MYCIPAAFPAFKRIFKQARYRAFLARQLPLFADDQQPVVFSPGPYVIPGQTPMSGSKAQK